MQGVVEVVKRGGSVHGRVQDETVGVLEVLEVSEGAGQGGLSKAQLCECDKVPCGMPFPPSNTTFPACLT